MQRGFSLVELSIVLVILGLLTGGILAGQSLIRASELRAVSTELARYTTSLNTFRDKYFALPGDMPNAQKFWGDVETGTVICSDPAVPAGTPGTCNGNGDGFIAPHTEGLRAWQHMAMAGLIEGSYVGYDDSGTYIGSIVPRSKISDSGYDFLAGTKASMGWTGSDITATYTFIRFARLYTGADLPRRVGNYNLKAEEAWNLDTKMDDGRPAAGGVFAWPVFSCATSGDVATAQYALNDSSTGCMLHVKY